MPEAKMHTPVKYRALLVLAGWLAPGRTRAALRARWSEALQDLWILAERGEVISGASEYAATVCRGAFADSFWQWLTPRQVSRALRGPAAVFLSAAAIMGLAALATHGFASTRGLFALAPGTSWASGDERVPYAFGLVFALVCGGMAASLEYRPTGRHGWRYHLFLIFKLAAAATLVPLLWIESSLALRTLVEASPFLSGCGALFSFLLLIAAVGYTLLWVFADQQRRCPVCLERLSLPVSVGSWSSILEPAAEEMVCANGHGALSLQESDPHAPDRWTRLDESWQDLFASPLR